MAFEGMSSKERNAAARHLVEENRKYTAELRQVPFDHARPENKQGVVAVWRSNRFMVQVYEPADGAQRLSVSRTAIDVSTGRWMDGITWEELQAIKNAVGFRDRMAVEIFPEADAVVNVANMRHLWVLPEPLAFAWRKKE